MRVYRTHILSDPRRWDWKPYYAKEVGLGGPWRYLSWLFFEVQW